MIRHDIDPKLFERIEDLLQQIRTEYGNWFPKHEHNIERLRSAILHLDAVISLHRRLGENNAVGWL